jgi:uroporphyrinogen III methyltransferase/synthase
MGLLSDVGREPVKSFLSLREGASHRQIHREPAAVIPRTTSCLCASVPLHHVPVPSPVSELPFLNMSQSTGIVYLIGAGPGDEGLITVRGAQLLADADVVVYDALANIRLLDRCRDDAERIYVGKKASDHSLTQEQINALLVEKASAGKRVARLKGGDPFIFGRGGEECEALAKAAIRFEVVPGITAAIAAPAYAGIPVTHRDFNSSFTLITGHEKEQEYQDPAAVARATDAPAGASDLNWAALAKLPCLAFYMGAKSLPRICQKLIDHGMAPATPAATIQWGTTPRQRTIVGTVQTLPDLAQAAGIGPPALTIIGRVVELRQTMNWFESRPFFGQTIVVTRTRQQSSDLSRGLADLGAAVIEAPTIELEAPGEWSQVDEALERVEQYDWVIFTSANGVQFVRQRLLETVRDARVFYGVKIAAIGDATAAAIRQQLCLRVDLCPEAFVAEALADALVSAGEVAGKRFLLLRADIARPLLVERLIHAGAADVSDVSVYHTRAATSLPAAFLSALDAGEVSWITFTSSSTARNLVALLTPTQRERLRRIRLASIGPITSRTLEELGLSPDVQAETYNIPGLVRSMLLAVRK